MPSLYQQRHRQIAAHQPLSYSAEMSADRYAQSQGNAQDPLSVRSPFGLSMQMPATDNCQDMAVDYDRLLLEQEEASQQYWKDVNETAVFKDEQHPSACDSNNNNVKKTDECESSIMSEVDSISYSPLATSQLSPNHCDQIKFDEFQGKDNVYKQQKTQNTIHQSKRYVGLSNVQPSNQNQPRFLEKHHTMKLPSLNQFNLRQSSYQGNPMIKDISNSKSATCENNLNTFSEPSSGRKVTQRCNRGPSYNCNKENLKVTSHANTDTDNKENQSPTVTAPDGNAEIADIGHPNPTVPTSDNKAYTANNEDPNPTVTTPDRKAYTVNNIEPDITRKKSVSFALRNNDPRPQVSWCSA